MPGSLNLLHSPAQTLSIRLKPPFISFCQSTMIVFLLPLSCLVLYIFSDSTDLPFTLPSHFLMISRVGTRPLSRPVLLLFLSLFPSKLNSILYQNFLSVFPVFYKSQCCVSCFPPSVTSIKVQLSALFPKISAFISG